MTMACVLRYLVRGVNASREDRADFETELRRASFDIDGINMLPVVNGFTLELELTNLGPFNEDSIEPYLRDNLVASSVQAVFRKASDEFEVVLQRVKFNP